MEDLGLDDVPTLLTVPEFAAALRVHRTTVVRWIEAGTLTALKPGRDYRIPASELRRLLASPPDAEDDGDGDAAAEEPAPAGQVA